MTKLHPLTPLLAPPLWAYSAGFVFGSLASVLGSEHPDLVTASFRAVGFTLAFPVIGLLTHLSREEAVSQAPSAMDLRQALREGRAEERELAEQMKYAAQVNAGSQKVKIGKRSYNFPAGIGVEHLLALADVVGRGEPPTDRALVPPFKRGEGETYQTFRDWVVYHAGEKPGDLAQFRSRKMDWDFTPLGTVMLHEWLMSFYSPTNTPPDVKKTLNSLSKAKRERTSKGNNAIS